MERTRITQIPLADARKSVGLTQEELSCCADVSVYMLQKFEHDERNERTGYHARVGYRIAMRILAVLNNERGKRGLPELVFDNITWLLPQ